MATARGKLHHLELLASSQSYSYKPRLHAEKQIQGLKLASGQREPTSSAPPRFLILLNSANDFSFQLLEGVFCRTFGVCSTEDTMLLSGDTEGMEIPSQLESH